MDSPQLAEFVGQLDRINALADAAPGFVWRLTGASGNATDVRGEDPTLLVNMSVWVSPEALFEFVYKSAHVGVMARRREWFERIEVFQVLWWVPAGHIPSVAEGRERLEHYQLHGATPFSFWFSQPFPAPQSLAQPVR